MYVGDGCFGVQARGDINAPLRWYEEAFHSYRYVARSRQTLSDSAFSPCVFLPCSHFLVVTMGAGSNSLSVEAVNDRDEVFDSFSV